MILKTIRGWVIPWFGYVGVDGPFHVDHGVSSDSGFTLLFRKPTVISFKTLGYEASENLKGAHPLYLAAFVLIMSIIFASSYQYTTIYFLFLDILVLGFFIKGTLSIFSELTVFLVNYRNEESRNLRQWHACEFKAIMIINSGMSPSMENIRNCPMISITCGVTRTIIKAQCFILVSLVYYFGRFNQDFTNPVYIAILILLGGTLTIMAFHTFPEMKRVNTKMMIITYLLMSLILIPASILPVAIQRFVYLEEPSEEKYITTVREIGTFLAVMSQLKYMKLGKRQTTKSG